MPAMKKIRILVADDHAILRSGLKMLINAQPDMEVVSEAPDGDRATLAKDITRMTHVPVLFSMESNGARRKSQTHFEQVPIEVVKKIAEQDVSVGKYLMRRTIPFGSNLD